MYQKTRWLGAINLLLSTKRAYEKEAFLLSETACPLDLETIEIYIQILLPPYFTTLNWERNNSSIADVIPSVLFLIYAWKKMDIQDKKAKELCYFLIHFIREKFKYEMESAIYQVNFYSPFPYAKFHIFSKYFRLTIRLNLQKLKVNVFFLPHKFKTKLYF